MFIPREQQQNPGCLDETLSRYTDQCHFVLSFYPRRQEFEPCMLLLWLRNHRVLSDRKKSCMHTYVTFEGISDTRCPLPRESRRAPASTHVICNPRDEAARLKKLHKSRCSVRRRPPAAQVTLQRQTPASSPASVNHSARAPEPTQVIVCRRPGVQR